MGDLDDVAADTTRCTNDKQRRTVPQGGPRRPPGGLSFPKSGAPPPLARKARRVAGESFRSFAFAYSANDPLATPNTESPTASWCTASPVATTVPATSRPSTGHARPPHPGRQANEIRLSCKQVPRAAVDASSLDPHEHLVVGDSWHGNLVHPDYVGIPVAVMHCRNHGRRYGHAPRAR